MKCSITRPGIVRGRQDVQVADRFPPATQAAGVLDRVDARRVRHMRDQAFGNGQHVTQPAARYPLAEPSQFAEQSGLSLGANGPDARQPSLARCRLQRVHAVDVVLVV